MGWGSSPMNGVSDLAYDHALVELMHAPAYRCVRCEQVFKPSDKITDCPNAIDKSHSLIPDVE